MKKLYTAISYKKYNLIRSADRLKRNLITKEKKRLRRKGQQGTPAKVITERKYISQFVSLRAPKQFSFIEHPEETIEFINKLENNYLKRKKVFVNLSLIETMDYSAVTVLVSVMFAFKARKIDFNGNFPKNRALAKMLIDSGFFVYLKIPIGNKIEYIVGKENQIFARANKEVNSELGLAVMMETSSTIWGEKRTCKGLQRTLLELMQNTNNHADKEIKGGKHWWLSVNHDRKNKKVSFIFVDYGVGIFESLKNKPTDNKWFGWHEKLKKFKGFLKADSNDKILRLLLEGEMHLTVTGQHFRGKGLPGIKEVLDRNQISNLHIISNDVFTNVQNDNYHLLNNEFSGTFVSWELNESNQNLKWIV